MSTPQSQLDPYADVLSAASGKKRPGRLDDLTSFAREQNLEVGSTTNGRHNRGSKHYSGNAIDIHNSGSMSDDQVASLSQSAQEYGFKVRDERVRPKGQKVWGGPHVHIETDDNDPYADIVSAATGEQNTQPTTPITNAPVGPKLKTPRVTSTVTPADKPQLEPLKFEGDTEDEIAKSQGVNLMGRDALSLANDVSMQGMTLPKNHPDLPGKRVTLKFKKEPTPEEINDEFLRQLGGEGYVDLGNQFKTQTGLLLAHPDRETKAVKEGKGYSLTVRPTQGTIDAINAYARGDIEGLRSALNLQEAGRKNVAHDVQTELAKGGVRQDLNRLGAKHLLGVMQTGENLKDLAMYGGPNYVAPTEDPSARAIEQSERAIPGAKTITGKIADEALGIGGTIAQAEALGPLGKLAFPAQQALSVAHHGPEAAAKAAMLSIPLVATGPIAKAAGIEALSPVQRQIVTRVLAGYGMGGTALATGAQPLEALKSFGMGAAFPIGRTSPEDAEAVRLFGERLERARTEAGNAGQETAGVSTNEPNIGSEHSDLNSGDSSNSVPTVEGQRPTDGTLQPAVTEATPHHSTQQLRRARNTEHGNRGQFKAGKVEPTKAESEVVQQSTPSLEPTNGTKQPETPLVSAALPRQAVDSQTTAPANESILSQSLNSSGSDVHHVIKGVLQNPKWRKRVLSEIGVGATPLENDGGKASFRTAGGHIVSVRTAYGADKEPTLGTNLDGIIIEREAGPSAAPALATESGPAPSPSQVFYHATTSDFEPDSFRRGSHFGTAEAANDRLRGTGERYGPDRIMPVTLDVKHPLRVRDGGLINPIDGFVSSAQKQGVITKSEADSLYRYRDGTVEDYPDEKKFYDLLESKGYDGLVYENATEDAGSDSYVTFRPEQVKSAIGQSQTARNETVPKVSQEQTVLPGEESTAPLNRVPAAPAENGFDWRIRNVGNEWAILNPEGKEIQRVKDQGVAEKIVAQMRDQSVGVEGRSLSQALRLAGGIKAGAHNRGELSYLSNKESGSSGLLNSVTGQDEEKLAQQLAGDGYGHGDWAFRTAQDYSGSVGKGVFEIDMDRFRQAVQDDATGTKKSYSSDNLNDFDWEAEERKHFQKEQDEHDADATVSLLENEASGVLYDKIQNHTATAADEAEFRQHAAALGISGEHTDKLIASAREAGVQEHGNVPPQTKANLNPGERERSLPKTLEAAQMEKGDNLVYKPESISGGIDSARETVKAKGIDGAIEHVLHGEPGIDWASTGFAALNEMRDQAERLRTSDPQAAEQMDTKRREFAGDFAERATKLGQAMVGIKAIEEFSPDRAAYLATKLSKKARGRGLTPEEDARITKMAVELEQVSKKYNSLQEEFARSQAEMLKRSGKQKAEKKDYQARLERRADEAKRTLVIKLGKLDFGHLKVPAGEKGAAKVGIPELPGDAELLAQYAASRLAKVDTVEKLNQELVSEFGSEVEPFLKDIRQRAYQIRKDARIAELEARDTEPARRRTILQDIQKEISASQQAVREAAQKQKSAARQSEIEAERQRKREAQEVDVAQKVQAKAELSVAKEGEGEGRSETIREARQRLKDIQREYREAAKAQVKGYREAIAAQREASRKAELWDTPIRNAAKEARTRIENGSDSLSDLVDAAAEKFLPDSIGGTGRMKPVKPSQFYADLKAEFPKLVTSKNQGEIYKQAYQKVKDMTTAAQEAAKLRSASAESQRLWEQVGMDVDTQSVLIQTAEARRRQIELRSKMAEEFNRVSRSRLAKFGFELQALPRALQSSIDAPLGRQGIFYMITHPVESARYTIPATVKGYAALKPENYHQRVVELESHPYYEFAKRAGVDLPELAGAVDARVRAEESFQSAWAEKLPHVRLSEQGFTLGMNTQRVNAFARYARLGESQGYTFKNNPEFFKQAAAFINDATGRGNMPDAIKRMSAMTNSLFYSTRLNISRVQLLNDLFNPVKYYKYDPVMRRAAAGELIRLAVGLGAIYGSAKAFGLGVTMNPDDPDFGKVRWGSAHYDVTGGEAATIRFLYRFLSGVYQMARGQEVERGKDPFTLATRFGRQKLAPWPGATLDYLTQKNAVGQPANLKFDIHNLGKTMNENIALRMATPMVVGDFVDAATEEGWVGVGKNLPGLGGVGITNYQKTPHGALRPMHKMRPLKDLRSALDSPRQNAMLY